MLALNEYRSILCLNGTLPDRSFFNGQLPIFAADGAANTLMSMTIKPEAVIGDLDSVQPEYLLTLTSHLHEDQNYCDFQKALFYLEKNNLLPCVVLGVAGGYLDHVLNNINLFIGTKNILYAPPIIGFCLAAGEEKTLQLPLNTKISLFAFPSGVINTKGLKWELTDYALSFPGANSCFNRTTSEQVFIHVTSGTALILIYNISI